jgi:hypothetical protein
MDLNPHQSIYMQLNPFSDTWVLWGHLPQDTSWSIQSYTKISKITCAEELIELLKKLPDKLITNYMLFLMREGVDPMWEDPNNKEGGCFSYKVDNKLVKEMWTNVCYCISGNSISTPNLNDSIMGLSISPKKSFCIMKIWMKSCQFQDASAIKIPQLNPNGCIFKKH